MVTLSFLMWLWDHVLSLKKNRWSEHWFILMWLKVKQICNKKAKRTFNCDRMIQEQSILLDFRRSKKPSQWNNVWSGNLHALFELLVTVWFESLIQYFIRAIFLTNFPKPGQYWSVNDLSVLHSRIHGMVSDSTLVILVSRHHDVAIHSPRRSPATETK